MIRAASALIVSIALAGEAIAAPPVFERAGLKQAQDFPGYCLEDWRGARSCYPGSDKPWMGPRRVSPVVHILTSPGGGAAPRHTCTATLVAPDWALTTAHCVGGRGVIGRYTIGVGFTDLSDGRLGGDGIATPIEEIRLHPDRRKGIDLALVRFREDPALNIANPTFSPEWRDPVGDALVQLVAPRPSTATVPSADARKIRFADIGGGGDAGDYVADSVLYRWSRLEGDGIALVAAPLYAIPDDLCNRQLGRRDTKAGYDRFCALTHERPVCPEDAGAPVFGGGQGSVSDSKLPKTRDFDGELLLVGVTTWTKDQCAAPGEPVQVILTTRHRDWIRDIIRASNQKREAESQRIADPALFDRDPPPPDERF